MKNGDLVAGILREWISKAENDLLAATHTLTLGQKCPTGVVCFHAQQCAEKYLKALLVSRGIDVPKTHDLELLIVRLGNETRLEVSPDDVTMLTQFAIGPRYPGSEEISRATARRAVAAARRIRKAVNSLLKTSRSTSSARSRRA